MQISSFESLTRKTALDAIDLYKHYLSPIKGFACPHRMLHGGESCSDYVKTLLTRQSLDAAVKMSVQRFRDCASANQTLRNQKAEGGCIVIPCCLPI